jgi:dipeptidyl aminopeptidase/acylaminoacyl peptidase
VKFSADGKTLWATIESKGIVPVFKLSADGTGLTPVYAQGTSSAIDLAAGTLVFLNDNTSRPNELFALDQASGAVRQLTHFNDAFMAQIDLGRVESYWFEGANREQVQGWLVYPRGLRREQEISIDRADARRPAHDEPRQLELPLEHAALRRARLRRHLGQPPRLDRL